MEDLDLLPHGLELLRSGVLDDLADEDTPETSTEVDAKDEPSESKPADDVDEEKDEKDEKDDEEEGESSSFQFQNLGNLEDWFTYIPHLLLAVPLLIAYFYQEKLVFQVVFLATFYIVVNKFTDSAKFETLHTVWTSMLTLTTVLLISSDPANSMKVVLIYALTFGSAALYLVDYPGTEEAWKYTSLAALCTALTIPLNPAKLV